MPNAVVVVDKFHVVKMANHALDSIRKGLRDGMDLKERRKLLRSRHLILRRRKDLSDKDYAAMEEWTNAIPALFAALAVTPLSVPVALRPPLSRPTSPAHRPK